MVTLTFSGISDIRNTPLRYPLNRVILHSNGFYYQKGTYLPALEKRLKRHRTNVLYLANKNTPFRGYGMREITEGITVNYFVAG